MTFKLALCLSLGLLAAGPVRSASPSGTIKGIVRDADTNEPLPFASTHTVQGPHLGKLTSFDGAFVIEGIEPGKVTFMAMNLLYTTTILNNVVVVADSVTTLDVQIMRQWPVPLLPMEPVMGPAADAARADPSRPFKVELPRGWFGSAARFSVMHYRDVFAVVSNRSPDLRVMDRHQPDGCSYTLAGIAEQLEPGTIYIDFAFFEGPGGSARYRPGREDSFDRELAKFLKQPERENSSDLLDQYVLDFIKWGSHWDVRVYCRKPYSEHDRSLAFQVLRSIRFLERPIVNGAQAVALAMQFLPREARIPENSDDLCGMGESWLAYGGQFGNRSTRITKTEEGFEVAFVLHENGHGEGEKGRWQYLVRWDGSIEAR